VKEWLRKYYEAEAAELCSASRTVSMQDEMPINYGMGRFNLLMLFELLL
jgi:hypothetical protein